MAGTRAGGLKTRETMYQKHGKDFYKEIGRKGGQNGHTGGFASSQELAKRAGAKGGKISKRGKSKMNVKLTKVQLEMIKHFKETKSITTACTLATTLVAMVEGVENGD